MAVAERACQNRQTGDAVLGFSASQVSWTKSGFQCPGPSNWTTYSTLSQFCFGNFQNVSSLYWGSNSYYPRGLILRKGKFSQLSKGMRPKSLSGWGIQIGPIAITRAKILPKIYKNLTLYTGGSLFILLQRGGRENGRVGKCKSANST